MLEFTEEQKNAIESEANAVIVSASAGSGKTSVLVERVVNLILDRTPLNKILIVTFTNFASNEMKNRIKNKIFQNNKLRNSIYFAEKSFICTIDSFYIYIFKKYIGRTLNFEILNKEQGEKLVEYVILSNLHKIYSVYDKEKIDLISRLNYSEDVENLVPYIKSAFYTLYVNNEENWKLSNFDSNTLLDNYVKKNMNYIFIFFQKIIGECSLCPKLKDNYLPFLHNDFESLKSIYEENRCVEFIQKIKLFSFSKLKPVRETSHKLLVSLLLKKIKNIIDSLKKIEYDEVQDYKFTFIKILKDIITDIKNFKEKYNCFEFYDIEKKVFELLSNNVNIRDDIKNQFNQVLIDEYQDINGLQDKIFNMISKKTFLVGDYKQSIYGFRGSNPNFFIEKNGDKINLNVNFRSQKQIINFVNECFESLMRKSTNVIEYSKNAKLTFYNNCSHKEFKNCVNLYMLDISSDDEKISKEMNFIVKEIKKLISSENYKLSDFCIMTRNYNKYKEIILGILNDNKINAKSDIFLDFFECEEITKLVLILRIVSDPENDIFVISLLSSDMFNFSISEIVKIKNRADSIYSFLKKKSEINNDVFSQKCKRAIDFIDELISNYNLLSMYDFVSLVINKVKKTLFEVYDEQKFKSFLNLTDEFVKLYKNNSILNLLEYIKSKKSEENELNFKNEGALLTTSIHKTKGKEYRVCFLIGCSDNFNRCHDKLICDTEFGFSFKLNKKNNLEYSLLKFISNQKKIEEEMRILYVALTRAKEKLYVVLSSYDATKEINIASLQSNAFEKIHPYFITGAKNFSEWILMVSCKSKNFKFKIIDMKNSPQNEENKEKL